MSFSEKIVKDLENNKEMVSQGNDWFKFKEGDNTIRILTEPVIFFEKFKTGICYTNCGYQGTAKYLTWIYDRQDGKVKLAKIPYSIAEVLATYEKDEDYAFDGFPMPYDIKINAKGAGTKEVVYTVLPKKAVAMADEVMHEVSKENTCEEIINKMKEKQIEKHKADGTWQKEQDRLANLKDELDSARVDKVTSNYPEEDSEGMANFDAE